MQPDDRTNGLTLWRKFGMAGFLFFLVKGLLWLAAPVFVYYLT